MNKTLSYSVTAVDLIRIYIQEQKQISRCDWCKKLHQVSINVRIISHLNSLQECPVMKTMTYEGNYNAVMT